ncbi:MAG: Gfo/Idh/MocA family oxidoreductase [Planctomycetia bacterium]|nr:Gfo/Idh/MocA family oxidoreductase [Planctomycetia bacterium]
MKKIKFGMIGCGLMGREFASAALRWAHLPEMTIAPEIVAVCDANPDILTWYTQNFPTIRLVTADYKELLADPEIQAIYCAVPHNLHEQFYCDIIASGKHLMGEKPFGIDLKANVAIVKTVQAHPDVVVRCSSEFPFYPAVQRMASMIDNNEFGKMIEVNAGFMHSSDLDPKKPINWKRMIEFNGEYGCMGDLGMHACHIPFRSGWTPKNVRAILTNLVPERQNNKGEIVPCLTWDNATLLCEVDSSANTGSFPMTIKTFRIAPGEKDTWFLEILGTKKCAKFSTKNPKLLQVLNYEGGSEQNWMQIDMGHETTFKSITGGIFEFGFSDAILQMWASFLYELENGKPKNRFAGCVLPEEAALSHRLFTAALESQKTAQTIAID